MAEELRYAYLASGTQLTIPARVGYSHRVVEMFIDSPAERSYVDVYVGPRIVARFPVKWNDCLFFAPNLGSINNMSLFGWIRNVFGEDFVIEADPSEDITFRFSASQIGVHVFYTETTEGVDKTKPLRSLSPMRVLFHILTHSAVINATKNYSLDVPVVPTGFSEIKDGFIVPSGRQLIIKGLAFGSFKSGTTTATKLHFWKENYEYFTPDRAGIHVERDRNFLVFDITRNDFFTFPDITCNSGEKLSLNFDATYDGTNTISAQVLALFIIGLEQPAR